MQHQIIDGLTPTPSAHATREQWTTTGVHRVTRGDIINLTTPGPVQPVVVLATRATTDAATGRDCVHITARHTHTGQDTYEVRSATGSVLIRCDLRYEPAGTADSDLRDDDSVLRDDFLGDGVYRPETDPAKIAAAKESLARIRDRLNQPVVW